MFFTSILMSFVLTCEKMSMAISVASLKHPLLFVLSIAIFNGVLSFHTVTKSTVIYPLNCSDHRQTCNSYMYHLSKGLQLERIASLYSVNTSQIRPIIHGSQQDYLVSVPCTCKDLNGTSSYIYDTLYTIQPGDSFENTSNEFYSGQAWMFGEEEKLFNPGNIFTMHLVCGCLERKPQEVVTYTVQKDDTLSEIAELLSAEVSEISNLNGQLTRDPSYIDVGWVLFVPMQTKGIQDPKQRKLPTSTIIICVLSAATLTLVGMFMFVRHRRNQTQGNRDEYSKAVTKSHSAKKITLQNQFIERDIEEVTTFESEKPIIFSLEEIDKATNNFDEARKIGEGGYGSVYSGILREWEVAIKKMKASTSKEFCMELKVLCKIHHINVVELLGYASGDNHLYLVYEYVQNGSLNDHIHDPLLKGHLPLSWTARTQIALDTARGIEYIHDHTKARYVHRDIKTSNILLDHGLRAKVADFGLTKLVERSNEDDFVATRLVGTPGYLPPESIRELQTTPKTDVFAFGVVLAELITGQLALVRDNRESNNMKSLISVIYMIFRDENIEAALEANIDGNLRGSYPAEEVYKMAEIARQCLNEDAVNRPEMQEIVTTLSQILMSSIEWEASLGGKSPVFSGLLIGR